MIPGDFIFANTSNTSSSRKQKAVCVTSAMLYIPGALEPHTSWSIHLLAFIPSSWSPQYKDPDCVRKPLTNHYILNSKGVPTLPVRVARGGSKNQNREQGLEWTVLSPTHVSESRGRSSRVQPNTASLSQRIPGGESWRHMERRESSRDFSTADSS
ncbi:unnamed protein product [Pleuronectes platessa]|uniref:Uncharacterized protein n=1 Tax=Pleuronectes platessa TaxID=8262 RepID=A0A9N7TWJ6_PLEPL|nr:unnamed protein product [Pleuronectes platessa]